MLQWDFYVYYTYVYVIYLCLCYTVLLCISTIADADSCAVTVAVRLRPFAQREINDTKNRRVVFIEGNEAIVQSNGESTSTQLYYCICTWLKMNNLLANNK